MSVTTDIEITLGMEVFELQLVAEVISAQLLRLGGETPAVSLAAEWRIDSMKVDTPHKFFSAASKALAAGKQVRTNIESNRQVFVRNMPAFYRLLALVFEIQAQLLTVMSESNRACGAAESGSQDFARRAAEFQEEAQSCLRAASSE